MKSPKCSTHRSCCIFKVLESGAVAVPSHLEPNNKSSPFKVITFMFCHSPALHQKQAANKNEVHSGVRSVQLSTCTSSIFQHGSALLNFPDYNHLCAPAPQFANHGDSMKHIKIHKRQGDLQVRSEEQPWAHWHGIDWQAWHGKRDTWSEPDGKKKKTLVPKKTLLKKKASSSIISKCQFSKHFLQLAVGAEALLPANWQKQSALGFLSYS